ncbi:hypothetical protein BP00DRAFT_456956 [Aspergillus indologenus CBS 114.80]|uniref:NB-ARC domain-containing protein n=1 Tax=Aspergillus indologenus CBS 114.80 TaxID=1450541 RepID=A0A2V5I3W5_9EURO|nr:hypothetical protein BP00DRAFT_456956 [Aspergillus indologenus CBS 114.80]
MLGDPALKDANREEWPTLVQKFLLLRPNQAPLGICSQQALCCLKAISDRFEEITFHSRLFHISCATVKTKSFFRLRSRMGTGYEGCVCDASVTVRKWTTADLDEEQKRCVFHYRSRYRRKLDMTAANEWEPRPKIADDDDAGRCGGKKKDISPSAEDSHVLSSLSFIRKLADPSAVETGEEVNIDRAAPVPSYTQVSCSHTAGQMRPDAANDARNEDYSNRNCDNGVPSETLVVSFGRPLPLQIRLPDRAPNFCGRQDILESLRAYFSHQAGTTPPRTTMLTKQTAAILTGMPGIRKTAIAREYVHHHGRHFSSIMWVQASHRQSIAQSFHEIAYALELLESHKKHSHLQIHARVTSWLQENKSDWLLNFDDADDLEVLRAYIPRCDHGNILVTSRSPDLDLFPSSSLLEFCVHPLSEEEVSELVHAITGLPREQVQDLGLVHLLGGNPLAVRMVGKALQNESQSRLSRLNDLEGGVMDSLSEFPGLMRLRKQYWLQSTSTTLLTACFNLD